MLLFRNTFWLITGSFTCQKPHTMMPSTVLTGDRCSTEIHQTTLGPASMAHSTKPCPAPLVLIGSKWQSCLSSPGKSFLSMEFMQSSLTPELLDRTNAFKTWIQQNSCLPSDFEDLQNHTTSLQLLHISPAVNKPQNKNTHAWFYESKRDANHSLTAAIHFHRW